MSRSRGGESGQAVVEAALTLPLTIFLILGTIQLFLMLQGRILAQYAIARATRAGSVHYGDCKRMTDTAIAALMPAITSFTGAPGGGTAGQKFGAAFAARAGNKYAAGDTAHVQSGGGGGGDIVWIVRHSPTIAQVVAASGGKGQDQDFDQFTAGGGAQDRLMRLETRMIFWFPLNIPFANWVISRMVLAQYGLANYTADNPLMPAQATSNWTGSSPSWVDGPVLSALQSRVLSGEYVFPIVTTYSMRMMTPATVNRFVTQNCPPTPASLL